ASPYARAPPPRWPDSVGHRSARSRAARAGGRSRRWWLAYSAACSPVAYPVSGPISHVLWSGARRRNSRRRGRRRLFGDRARCLCQATQIGGVLIGKESRGNEPSHVMLHASPDVVLHGATSYPDSSCVYSCLSTV